jgi:hypothetical protein
MAMNLRVPYRVPAGNGTSSPAIWFYQYDKKLEHETRFVHDVRVSLEFRNKGFMTESTPPYNEQWRITIDPTAPFYRYMSTYGNDDSVFAYLDYDGFRDGPFQTETGWCIKKDDLIEWQRVHLKGLGFTQSEIDDVNYTYARMLAERLYAEEYFLVYPQDTAIVDQSVALNVTPAPDTTYRLWLYFVPHKTKKDLKAPRLAPVVRKGFTVVELSYLTDREIPQGKTPLPHGARSLDGVGALPRK